MKPRPVASEPVTIVQESASMRETELSVLHDL